MWLIARAWQRFHPTSAFLVPCIIYCILTRCKLALIGQVFKLLRQQEWNEQIVVRTFTVNTTHSSVETQHRGDTRGTHSNTLRDLLQEYQPTRTLRSSTAHLLHQPYAPTSVSSRTFSVAAPAIWNQLTVNTRTASTLGTFKARLKTELFTLAYPA